MSEKPVPKSDVEKRLEIASSGLEAASAALQTLVKQMQDALAAARGEAIRGARGERGERGEPGPQGPPGPKGDKGDKG